MPLISPPQDVSPDWIEHMSGMAKVLRTSVRGGNRKWEWIETKNRFDLWICHCIICVIASMAGLVAIDPTDPFASQKGAKVSGTADATRQVEEVAEAPAKKDEEE
jgi:hypothetical protein